MQSDMENEKAVLMGNKESVIFIYMLNCVICVLFAIFLPHIGMVIRCSLPIIIMIFIFLLIITIATIVIYVIGMVISICIII